MYLSTDNLVLTAAQAACVALPAAGIPLWAARLRRSWWALVAPVSIAGVVAGISLAPGAADALTWVALVGVPVGAALAFGWAARGARTWLAPLAVALLAVAVTDPGGRPGQLAATILIAGSAVTVGRLLAGVAPLGLLEAGIYAMAALDAWLVFSGRLEAPNAVLVAAAPGLGLPQLQSASFGTAGLGYGDFFAAGVVGAILAARGRWQSAAALATLAATLAWDQLFAFYDILPATIPPAVVLAGAELLRRRRARGRGASAPLRHADGGPTGDAGRRTTRVTPAP